MKLEQLQEENERLKSRIEELESQIERHYESQRKEEKDKIFLSASVIASGIANRHGVNDTPEYAIKIAERIYEQVYEGRAK